MLIFCLWALLSATAWSQAPDTLWFRNFGGAFNDEGRQVQETSDGGLITVGSGMSFNFGNWDIYLAKTDSDGNTLWTRTFGGPNADRGNAIRQTSDDGFIVAGWQRASPQADKEICLLKTDLNGNLLWSRTYSEFQKQEVRSIELAPDGGYVLAGWVTEMPIFEDIFIMKTDSVGNVLWSRNYGGDDSDKAWSVKNASDGGYIIAGWSDIFPRGSDMYIIKTDQNGDSIWTRLYGGVNDDIATSILETPDHRFIVGGSYSADVYSSLATLLFLNQVGDSLATILLPYSQIVSMEMVGDGDLLICGSSEDTLSAAFVARTDTTGREIWARVFEPASPVSCYAHSAIQTSDSSYVFTGSTQAYPEDVVLAKLAGEQTGIDEEQHRMLPGKTWLGRNYPNPFNPNTTIEFSVATEGWAKLEIFNILGQKVRTLADEYRLPGAYNLNWNGLNESGDDVPSGVYLIKLSAGDKVASRKILLLK